MQLPIRSNLSPSHRSVADWLGCERIPVAAGGREERRSFSCGEDDGVTKFRKPFWNVTLPVTSSEMPPFGAQSIEAGVRHCCLQKIQVIAHDRIAASVTEHRRRCEVIEIGWHREWPPPIVYQSCINRHAPAVERTGTTVWIDHVIISRSESPQLCLGITRPISVPDFQAAIVASENCLSGDQSSRHTRPD